MIQTMLRPRSELADFLRRARANADRRAAQLPADDRVRRVAGLRREEVAFLAGVSTDYYMRLEQGRRVNPSSGVLDAVACALKLDASGRAHLHDLAGGRRAATGPDYAPSVVSRDGAQRLVDVLCDQPALALGPRSEVLASNRPARALLTDFSRMPLAERNYMRWILLSEEARELFVDWSEQARLAVENLRFDSARTADDPATRNLVAQLQTASLDFARWWDQHHVQQRTHGLMRLRHPLVGELTVDYETLGFPGDSGVRLLLITTPAGSAARRSLDRLIRLSSRRYRSRQYAKPTFTNLGRRKRRHSAIPEVSAR